jgi:2'-5' RNA ligase
LRLFIGIACPCTPVISRLLGALPGEPEGAADSRAAGLLLVAPDSLHITLKFIGAAAAPALPDIVSAMQRALANCKAFTLQLRGAGSFQSALWLGVEPNPALSGLATALNEAMAALGYAEEAKPFRPHLTLARLTYPPAMDSAVVGAGPPAMDSAVVGAGLPAMESAVVGAGLPAMDSAVVGAGLPAMDSAVVGAYPEGIKDPPAIPLPTQKRPNPGFDLQLWITQHQADQWGNLSVTAVHLYRSDTLPEGVRYTVLTTVPLRPPAA